MRNRIIGYLCLTTLTITAAACVSGEDLDQLGAQNQEILARLDRLEKAPTKPPRAGAVDRLRPKPDQTYAVPVAGGAQRGPDDAWVTIAIVSDFECPYCNRVRPTLDQITERYGDDVRMVFKHNPLPMHRNARSAAEAAECAGEQDKFWEMHDALFDNQRRLNGETYAEAAATLGLDTGRFGACLTGNRHDAKITADQHAAQRLGARGTPAFFINGRFLSGAQPLPKFTAVIDEELAKAKQSGVEQSDYYAEVVMAKGRKQP